MEERNIIVTSYDSPDLDGVAAMYAYSEYLSKIGESSIYYISKTPKKEVQIVCDMFDIKLDSTSLNSYSKVVIVDTNDPMTIPKQIRLDKVIEIIDHHIESDGITQFENAKVNIEMIGAVATIIAEKFKDNNIEISRESAILLYYAIISNSINLKAKITTQKDINMCNWLKERCSDINDGKIKEIFKRKSEIQDDLRKELEADLKVPFKDKSIVIAQLELVDAEIFLDKNNMKIRELLEKIKQEKQVDYIFLNCIDIWKGYNVIFTIDTKTEELLEEILGISFVDGKAATSDIIMRKELVKLLKDKFYV